MIYWTVAGDWILSGQRTGFFHSLFLNHTPTHVVWEHIDEDTSVVQAREHMARNLARNVNEISAKRTTSLTEERSKKVGCARRPREIYDTDPEDNFK